ncbi:hypothetical protein EVAR_95110_1 [Eumeta japonica]|uniref:Uncharacterized protein n=1 Tax=Eumeta variegata TaxID=151549 RepID=A0A4C1TE42_EUMVA|nr:hypothetical protein EVAR_95110_1 [Eumeta japonica]
MKSKVDDTRKLQNLFNKLLYCRGDLKIEYLPPPRGVAAISLHCRLTKPHRRSTVSITSHRPPTSSVQARRARRAAGSSYHRTPPTQGCTPGKRDAIERSSVSAAPLHGPHGRKAGERSWQVVG